MYKIILVDDEPLIQAGIKSILDWDELNMEPTENSFPDISGAECPVKIRLTPELLRSAVCRISQRLQEADMHSFRDKFFISLLHNLFESEEQFNRQSVDLNLDFHYAGYVCCYGELSVNPAKTFSGERELPLLSSALQMIRNLASKHLPCYFLTLDTRHFALIFCYEKLPDSYCPPEIENILQTIRHALLSDYAVSLLCGIGNLSESPLAIGDSYQCSRQAFRSADSDRSIVPFEYNNQDKQYHPSFNMSLFKGNLLKAFEEYDAAALQETINAICDLFQNHPSSYIQALDAACSILYLSISFLNNGETVVSEFFKDNLDGYRSVYKQNTVAQVISWLNDFARNLSEYFENCRRNYKNYIVSNVKRYIANHVREKLSLNEVAAVFGISPSYLSQLFGKYNESGFKEYVNICKINESKRLLKEGNLKVYEVAELLSFESAFYFSKVFKKIEGISPTDYLNERY